MPVGLEQYTDGTALLSVQNRVFLLGDLKQNKPYYGISDTGGICSPKEQKLGPFYMNEMTNLSTIRASGDLAVLRLEFGKSQLLLEAKEKAFQKFNLAYPAGISIEPYTDNSTAGHLLLGEKNIPIIFKGNTKTSRPLKGLEDGSWKIKEIRAEGNVVQIIGEDNKKLNLVLPEKPSKGGFYEVKVTEMGAKVVPK